jgi:hypothetical protein
VGGREGRVGHAILRAGVNTSGWDIDRRREILKRLADPISAFPQGFKKKSLNKGFQYVPLGLRHRAKRGIIQPQPIHIERVSNTEYQIRARKMVPVNEKIIQSLLKRMRGKIVVVDSKQMNKAVALQYILNRLRQAYTVNVQILE